MFCTPAALPRVTSLQLVSGTDSALTLNCTSTGSPATTVVWTKNGSALSSGGLYESTQILRDPTTATYDNLITATAAPVDLIGLYACIVQDSIGHNSQLTTLAIEGNSLT